MLRNVCNYMNHCNQLKYCPTFNYNCLFEEEEAWLTRADGFRTGHWIILAQIKRTILIYRIRVEIVKCLYGNVTSWWHNGVILALLGNAFTSGGWLNSTIVCSKSRVIHCRYCNGSATTVFEPATAADSSGSVVGNGIGVVSIFCWVDGKGVLCCCNSCNSSNSSILNDISPPPLEPCRTLKLSNVRNNAWLDSSQRWRRAMRTSFDSKSECSACITSDRVAVAGVVPADVTDVTRLLFAESLRKNQKVYYSLVWTAQNHSIDMGSFKDQHSAYQRLNKITKEFVQIEKRAFQNQWLIFDR